MGQELVIRFHSHYTDAAGNQRAQFTCGPGPDARARATEVRGEICYDARSGIVTLEDLSGLLSREAEVALKRAWRAKLGA